MFTLSIHTCTLFVYTARATSDEGHMPPVARKKNPRNEVINLRASRTQKTLIDRAARITGRNRSDFMLESACREAEAVLLDQRYFVLPEPEYKRFLELLDAPPKRNPRLARLLNAKAPWEK